MEQSRKGTTGSVNTQRTSTGGVNTERKYSAGDTSTNFQTPKPTQGQPQHGQPGEKTGSRNPQQGNPYHGKGDADKSQRDKR